MRLFTLLMEMVSELKDGSNRTVKVRLYAIDAPEGGQKYGQEATNHLRQVVKNGRFWLQVIGDPDPNGRTVAVVYKDSLENSHTLNYLRCGLAGRIGIAIMRMVKTN